MMSLTWKTFLITLCLTPTLSAVADSNLTTKSTIVYKYLDAKGVLHLTNKMPKHDVHLLYVRSYLVPSHRLLPTSSKPKLKKHKKYKKYAPLIKVVARDTRLHPALLHAVVEAESAYNPKAISPSGAVGLMQLMPATAKRYQVKDRTDPKANLKGGARYLRDLLTLFNNNLSLALAAYNAGEHAVKRHGNRIPPYRETRNYVKKVKRLYRRYLSNL